MAAVDLSDGERHSYRCMPMQNSFSKIPKKSTLLTPLLNDLMALLTVREGQFEYYTALIFTDGEISDVEQAMNVKSLHYL